MVVITVKETLNKLKENNKTPRRIFNKDELTQIVQAVLSDSEYVAENTKIKSGQFVTEDYHLSKDFKKALMDILKQLGLNSSEAEAAVEKYKVPKSLATAAINAVHHADHIYMNEVGKAIKLLGKSDVIQTFHMKEFGDQERRYHIPKKDGKDATFQNVKVKKHRKIVAKSRYNPSLKELLK